MRDCSPLLRPLGHALLVQAWGRLSPLAPCPAIAAAAACCQPCLPHRPQPQDEDKLVPVDSHKLFAISGEAGDRVNFSEYIIANVRGMGAAAMAA